MAEIMTGYDTHKINSEWYDLHGTLPVCLSFEVYLKSPNLSFSFKRNVKSVRQTVTREKYISYSWRTVRLTLADRLFQSIDCKQLDCLANQGNS